VFESKIVYCVLIDKLRKALVVRDKRTPKSRGPSLLTSRLICESKGRACLCNKKQGVVNNPCVATLKPRRQPPVPNQTQRTLRVDLNLIASAAELVSC